MSQMMDVKYLPKTSKVTGALKTPIFAAGKLESPFEGKILGQSVHD